MGKKVRVKTDAGSPDLGQNPFGALEPPAASPPKATAPPKAAPPRQAAATGKEPPEAGDGGELRLSGRVELRREKAGRGGKTATTVRGPIFSSIGAEKREALLKTLKNRLGTGGSRLSDGLEIRGDYRDQLESYLSERGAKVVRAGG